MPLLPTEVLALLVSLLSVILALLAYRRSEKALEIAKQANDLSTEANEIAKSQLSQTATDSDLLNTPGLSFRVWLDTTDLRTWRVITEITNTGRYSTEIVDGEVWLKPDQHPQRQYAQKLNGVKIAGLAKHVIEIKCKQSLINSPGARESPAEVLCSATYTRAGKENGTDKARHRYDPNQRDLCWSSCPVTVAPVWLP